ncbi:hypothetical protein niasHT_034788 [Heterodera trifolii]|uniref:BTB domain-containing protein n=1 Tax=Heterodera trifolii TaxID=157864 RepID=A0ABD2IKG1_9BILA
MLFNTLHGADVHFLVGKGGKKTGLMAHKTILMGASEVFEAMFKHEEQNETKAGDSPSNPIVVIDIEAITFKAMLRYIYTNDLSAIDGDGIDMLYAANKYHISGLIDLCRNFPILKLPNVFYAFRQASFLEETELATRCLAYIDRNADTLIRSDEFLQIDHNLLCEILSRDQLTVKGEIAIWDAAIRWADEQCRENGISCLAANRRAVLGSALLKVRFPLISHEDLWSKIVPSAILSHEQLLGLLIFHFHPERRMPNMFPLQFLCQERVPFDESDGSKAKISLKINNFSEFAQDDGQRTSDFVYASGFSFKLVASKCATAMGMHLEYCAEKGFDFRCKCSATIRIASKNDGPDGVEHESGPVYHGRVDQTVLPTVKISFEELMADANGWYNEEENVLTVKADVTVEGAYQV